MPTRVLVFGTFDLFHAGHVFFLEQAAALGDELHVAVARDSHVELLKHHASSRPEAARLATVARQPLVRAAHLSDEILGSYELVRTLRPDMIALGHDQTALETDLRRWIAEQGIDLSVVRMSKQP